jgi:dipeptidyl aminopeptidase/acylaminoacyl peptidase
VEEPRDVIMPQVYRAAERGYVDIWRVAMTGQSYGGYGAAALISATNLFRAAVSVSGINDLAGLYGTLNQGGAFDLVMWAEKSQGRMGWPPWSELRRYLENSPYYRADRIRTPLLILHGRDDTTIPVEDAEKMFSALRRLCRIAQLADYEHEGHTISDWELRRAKDATECMLDFLHRHFAMGRKPPNGR